MEATTSEPRGALSWAGQALTVTAALAVVAKVVGVLIAPGLRGIVSQRAVETFDTLSATFAYTLAALLVALVCASSFELARARKIGGVARGTVVAVSGLVIALASPAVVMHLHTAAALALAITTSIIVLVGGVVALRSPQTRVVGAVLALLSLCALVRAFGWELAAVGASRPSPGLFRAGRVLATIAVGTHAIAVMAAAAWLGTRSRVRGRGLAIGALVVAVAITYLATRTTETAPSASEAVLRAAFAQVGSVPTPYALGSIAVLLVPTSVLLAAVALVQRTDGASILAILALALLSHGAFDVPLHALAAAAAAHWAMLATAANDGTKRPAPRRRRPAQQGSAA